MSEKPCECCGGNGWEGSDCSGEIQRLRAQLNTCMLLIDDLSKSVIDPTRMVSPFLVCMYHEFVDNIPRCMNCSNFRPSDNSNEGICSKFNEITKDSDICEQWSN